MDFYTIAQLIRVIAQIFIWIVIASVILKYFISPYHPVIQALDRIVDPFLNPIRQIMPSAGMFDFSPIVLILIIELLSRILFGVFASM